MSEIHPNSGNRTSIDHTSSIVGLRSSDEGLKKNNDNEDELDIDGKRSQTFRSQEAINHDDILTSNTGIKYISYNIINPTKDWCSDVNVLKEMGLQQNRGSSPAEIEAYRLSLITLRDDLNATAAAIYRKLVTKVAVKLGMKLPNSNCLVGNWKQVGEDFRKCPTWKNAAIFYHSIYTSLDSIPSFIEDLETYWMKERCLNFSDASAASKSAEIYNGVRLVIVSKLNSVRKDINKRVSSIHGFRVTKTIKSTNGKQAPRRNKGEFKAEFVQNKNEEEDFELYLRKLHGSSYSNYEDNMIYIRLVPKVMAFSELVSSQKINEPPFFEQSNIQTDHHKQNQIAAFSNTFDSETNNSVSIVDEDDLGNIFKEDTNNNSLRFNQLMLERKEMLLKEKKIDLMEKEMLKKKKN
jgi:hypothetical protein